MNKIDKIKQAISYYSPQFMVEKIEFIREDTACQIYDIYGLMNETSMFSVYAFVSIKAIVKGNKVIKYRAVINNEFFINKSTTTWTSSYSYDQ